MTLLRLDQPYGQAYAQLVKGALNMSAYRGGSAAAELLNPGSEQDAATAYARYMMSRASDRALFEASQVAARQWDKLAGAMRTQLVTMAGAGDYYASEGLIADVASAGDIGYPDDLMYGALESAGIWVGTDVAAYLADNSVGGIMESVGLLSASSALGEFSALLDSGVPAVLFGAASELVSAAVPESVATALSGAMENASGLLSAAGPITAGVAAVAGAIVRMAAAAEEAQTRSQAGWLRDLQEQIRRERQLVFGDANGISAGGRAGRQSKLTGLVGRKSVFGRFEGAAFWRTSVGRVVRSLLLGHAYTQHSAVDPTPMMSYYKPVGDNGPVQEEGSASADAAYSYMKAKWDMLVAAQDVVAARTRAREMASKRGLVQVWAGSGSTWSSALEGDRTMATMGIGLARSMYRAGMIPDDEILIVSHHYTRATNDRKGTRWDGSQPVFRPGCIRWKGPAPTEGASGYYKPHATKSDVSPVLKLVFNGHIPAAVIASNSCESECGEWSMQPSIALALAVTDLLRS